jgi:hypothetical protein
MEGAEAIGEAVTGGLAARALEPKAGEAPDGHGRTCLNCGAELIGTYCHSCGQQARVHRTLGAFGHELLHGVLHFEGKIWRTLPMLAWRPGELTRRYAEGERAKFVSPTALFLFSVFLMFAVVSAMGGPFDTGGGNALSDVQSEADEERPRLRRQLAALEVERAKAVAAKRDVTKLDEQIEDIRDELGVLNVIRGDEATKDGGKIEIEDPANVGDGWFKAAYRKAKENPKLLIYKLQTNAYKFSWALIPISVPFVWLLFVHRRRYRRDYKAYDHVVFVTYSIAFMSIGFIALTLLRPFGIGDGLVSLAITLVPPIHMYRQLRGAYRLSRFSAVWRTFMLLVFASIASSLFLGLLLLLGLLG